MEGGTLLVSPRISWRVGTVVEIRPETPTARRIRLAVPDWPGNDAGQHVDLRLTAPDGYQATRSYSLASAGLDTIIDLAVDKVPDGEVSPFLVDELLVGDQLEIRGPLGGWFIWTPPVPQSILAGDEVSRRAAPQPVQLIAGGSGVVPLVSMIRAHTNAGDSTPFRLLYSVRTPDDVFYREEIATASAAPAPLAVTYVYTRLIPDGWPVVAGRITAEALRNATFAADLRPRLYVCGSTDFVEQVLDWLIVLGHDSTTIRAERFGGTR
jgi:ferredoxin-NADP reductase